jgi:hypothetical protein
MTKEKYYMPVPGYAPLGVSSDGEFINLNTKAILTPWCSKQKLRDRTELTYTVGSSVNSLPTRRITVQRAMALCYLPVPDDLTHLPIDGIYACKKSPVLTYFDAMNLNNIEWRAVKPKRGMMTVIVTEYTNQHRKDVVNKTLMHGLKAAVVGTGIDYQRALAESKKNKVLRFRNFTFEITHVHMESE